MAEISVIVPVCNVENYLAECLDSIIGQTFKDIEIICVNDGSTDNSRKILEDYKNKDVRIKIIDKKNGGLSSARNAGLKIAAGKYICFVDSDDWISESMFEKLYNKAELLSSDIVICAVHLFNDKNKRIEDTDKYYTLEYFDKSFDNKNFSYEDTKSFIMNVGVMAWNKLYRREFLEQNNAKFPDGLIFEDGPFFFSIFFKTDKVSLVRDFLYYYRINRKGSIVEQADKRFLNIIDVVELMYNYIKDLECFPEIKNMFYREKCADIIWRYNLLNNYNKSLFSKKLNKKKFLFDENIFDFEYMKKEHFWILYKIFEIRAKSNIIKYYYDKIEYRVRKKIMFKIMQILYTEDRIYYFKLKKFILRLKKRPELCDVWYENDKICVVILNKIKFSFKFEYSKLEKKQ